ncbi:MAG: transcription termination/antitermination protein NusA [Armatimonadetes bacterium]|nr:transcription termination/antitermination protein NusA [Armatimonadota bacterium]
MDILNELKQIATEREIPLEELKVELEQALAVAYKKFKASSGDAIVRLDATKKSGAVVEKEVVGEVLDFATQIGVDAARRNNPDAQVGDFVAIEIDPNTFGRIAAQTFKQVLQQKLREVELRRVHEQFSDQIGEVVSGLVARREESNVMIQVNRHEVELPKREQVPTDDYRPNERIKVYVLKIDEGFRGFKIIVSRSHPNLLRKLVELEVPEVSEGIVEIMSVAREPGQRSKVAVLSHDERIDAVGACVGQRGARIQAIMDELRPEKVDVVPFSADAKTFIMNALSPAKVNSIRMDMENRSAYVIVPDTQLSLAIGRGGQNVRLAARLTEWKIDIRSEAQAADEAREARQAKPEAAVPVDAKPE